MNKIWVIMQSTKAGELYFRGGYPELVSSWTPALSKAAKWTGEQVANVREHCQSHTSGPDCKVIKT